MEYAGGRLVTTQNGPIGWITFNNPARRNAISIEMWEGVGDALEAFQADPAVREEWLNNLGYQLMSDGQVKKGLNPLPRKRLGIGGL